MALTSIEKTDTLNELNTDPKNIGYNVAPTFYIDNGAHQDLANLLNALDPAPTATILVDSVTIDEVHSAIDPTEYETMMQNGADARLAAKTAVTDIDVFANPDHVADKARAEQWEAFIDAYDESGVIKGQGNIVNLLKNVWPNTTTTWVNLTALQSREASRVEAIINREYTITHLEVAEILA